VLPPNKLMLWLSFTLERNRVLLLLLLLLPLLLLRPERERGRFGSEHGDVLNGSPAP
jgi:hypothetical protein